MGNSRPLAFAGKGTKGEMMKNPKLNMVELTDEECEAIAEYLRGGGYDGCPLSFMDPNRFCCETWCHAIIDGNDILKTCGCFSGGEGFAVDALITLLDWNGYELKGKPEDYELIVQWI